MFERKSFWESHPRLSCAHFLSLPFCPLSSLQEKQHLIEGSEIAALHRALPWGPQGPRHDSQKISKWPLCKPGSADMKCCNWGRDGGYLCFAFALAGPPGLLVRCPFCRLGNKNKKKKKVRWWQRGRKSVSWVLQTLTTVTQQHTVANTVGTLKKMHEKTLTSLLFVYCVNMATGLAARSLFEGSGQSTQRGIWRAEDSISM